MDHSWIEKIVAGLIVLVVVIYGLFRLGLVTAAAGALGYVPMSKIPTRLRRFLFGERNEAGHKLNN
ncbi:MAG TPA: hypothetical protein VKB49_11680 [Candidatus Sulfotelmatobacter sp.]|nr:hypothetical protein [Candidatus Sulfotelmatobacter sp.]